MKVASRGVSLLLGFRHRRRMVIENLPMAVHLFIDKGIARLHLTRLAGRLGQGEGVDAAVHGHVAAQQADVAVVDLAYRLERYEVIEVVLDLSRRGAQLIGHGWLQHRVRRVQVDHRLSVTGLQHAVPTVKQTGNLTVLHAVRHLGHSVVDIRRRLRCLNKRCAQGKKQGNGRGFEFHCDIPVVVVAHTLPTRQPPDIGQPESFSYAIWQMAHRTVNKV
ncbi:hypothetical protein [Pseudomonas synxantha]|nr:hypothetical protein [Pseudomonas synxantha]